MPFLRYLLNSFVVSATVTVRALWFHSMAAYALARLKFKGRDTIFLLIFSTLLVSLPVILIPTFVVVRSLGLIDSYAGLIVPAIFNAFGIFLLRQFYVSLPAELEEAALVDGASYWRVYRSIILPLSRPILSALGGVLLPGQLERVRLAADHHVGPGPARWSSSASRRSSSSTWATGTTCWPRRPSPRCRRC